MLTEFRTWYMKNQWINPAVAVALTGSLIAFSCFKRAPQQDITKDKTKLEVILQGLQFAHYQPKDLNDDFSHKVFDLYLKRMDYSKRFLLQEDIDRLSKYRNELDDQMRADNVEFFDVANEIILQRTKDAKQYCSEILEQPFDFSKNEMIETDPKKISYPKTREDMKDSWRKYLKQQALIRVADNLESQEKAEAKKDTSVKIKSMQTLEMEARKRVKDNINDLFKRLGELDREDRIAMYFNAIANSMDTHTEYFPPKDKENFDIQLSGQLEGIGATLQEKDDHIKVMSIVPGSPSYKQGDLKAGDVITMVAQGKSDPVNVEGMRLDDAIKLIRGKKGTEVRLTVKKPDGSKKIVPIVRDIVQIEETFAQSAIIKSGGDKIGYIKLPTFYADFNRQGGRSSAEDVKKEVLKLKAQGVQGIVLDLRNNGGGSLDDVVRMAGLFIARGPIVQVKGRDGAAQQLDDNDKEVVYSGPLAVMVNSNSASASEIMAAAIQDYKRGIIVGSKQTFGKGTVQRFFNLDDNVPGNNPVKPLGSIKITMQKFYRINGGATQLRGVVPDVILPDPLVEVDRGEADTDAPLAWDEIQKSEYITWSQPMLDYKKIRDRSQARTSKSAEFKLISEESKMFRDQKDKTEVSLNLEKYRAEDRKQRDEAKKLKDASIEFADFMPTFLPDDPKASAPSDSVKNPRGTEFLKSIRKDVYLNETVNIVRDLKN